MTHILKDKWLWYNGSGIVFVRDGINYWCGGVPKRVVKQFSAIKAK